MSRLNNIETELKKVALIGLSESGKTVFSLRSTMDIFPSAYKRTVAVDFKVKVLEINAEKQLKLEIWDIEGAVISANMMRIYLKEAALVILFVDLSRMDSCIDYIMKHNFKQCVNENTKFAVVFTKSDLIEKNRPSKEKLQEYTQKAFEAAKISEKQILTREYFVTSAENGTGINEAFQHWANLLTSPPIIIPALVLRTPEKKGGLLSWFDSSSKSEDDDHEPLVCDFSF